MEALFVDLYVGAQIQINCEFPPQKMDALLAICDDYRLRIGRHIPLYCIIFCFFILSIIWFYECSKLNPMNEQVFLLC